MFVVEIINRCDVGTHKSFTLKAREGLCLSETVHLAKDRFQEAMNEIANMFAVLIASRLCGPIIWIGLVGEIGSFVPTALQDFINSARVVLMKSVTRG